MHDHRSALAANVRSLREAHGLSLGQLAERCGIAKATLFKIERQRTNPTLETLLALADTFSVPLQDLVAAPERPAIEIVRRRDDTPTVSDTVSQARLLKSLLVGSTLVEVQDVTFYAGQALTSMSHGAGAREHVFVRRGRITVGPVDEPVEAGPGDYVTYLADRPHRWVVGNRSDALLWVVHTFPRAVDHPLR